jgi:hypothetical protein
MSLDNMRGRLPSPWREFLTELDGMLEAARYSIHIVKIPVASELHSHRYPCLS